MTSRTARAGRLPTISAAWSAATYVNALGGSYRHRVRDRDPDHRRAQRAHPDLPGRLAVGADPPGPGARRPAARAGHRHRARGRRRDPLGLRHLSRRRSGRSSPTSVAVKANELALEGARAEQQRRHPHRPRRPQRRAGAAELAGRAGDRAGATPMSPASSCSTRWARPRRDDLGLDGGPLYDPLGNYRRVAGNWNDWASDPRHVPVATRTVDPTELPATRRSRPSSCRPGADRAGRHLGRDSAAAISDSAPMQTPGREPSMEDILASIKKVIAEEKELRTAAAGDAAGREDAERRRRARARPAARRRPPTSARRCSTKRSPATAASRSSN